VADAQAPAGGGRGSEEWGAGHAWAGPEKRGVGRAPYEQWHLGFIQINSNKFELIWLKGGTYQSPKIPYKIWVERDRDKEQLFL
jgi:hypothetical protein